ncbi:hypothetical protein [Zobellia sp. 1_MG-2023]|uniref:hypothetical protein n=1 Tax=Zobellia sp. 1_MG-2023 TaxID=3062626 RepID=UPI0026E32706|nr:hypothetical protein [Zobellia sp. 1_MG-2023]MDO6818885.1 hypothetical protein [Zobellia sp. 1_MG-2023]
MDLGYKTNLPFVDLVTPEIPADNDDNFLTPLEILTVNPTTILDYRKLLLEINGVRNAWLEPMDQEVSLFIDHSANKLVCSPPSAPDPIEPIFSGSETVLVTNPQDPCAIENPKFLQLHLNGIYKVFIEKDTTIVQTIAQEQELINEVKKLLAAHRNLCEDFKDEICLLSPLELGVCAEVEIDSGFAPEKVYGQIIKNIRNFIQPQIKYYTLNELLEKGKSIDDIFAGRPFMHESYGFVDTEELEALDKRKEIHLSDLYTVILNVEGVLRVKKIHINGGTKISMPEFCAKEDDAPSSWATGISISTEEVPFFSLEETCVDLYSTEGYIPLDKIKIHRGFSFLRKFLLPSTELDTEVPVGRHLDDLDSFESIQNDFPVVYGIGDDGLPERATLLRKSQALQLKGYLLFYDQLLANYTAQLSRLRSLFSLKPEEEREPIEKHTYFSQLPENVPGLNELLKFYEAEEQMSKGTKLAIPVARDSAWEEAISLLESNPTTRLTIADYCDTNPAHLKVLTFSSAAIRYIYINQLIDSFFNEAYQIEFLIDKGGYFFVLYPNIPSDIAFVGTKRFSSSIEAINEARSIAFLSSLSANYQLVSDLAHPSGSDYHYFNLSYSPIPYFDFIQGLAEGDSAYLQRRKLFLDHLLARFGEVFTDYTLQQYQNTAADSGLSERTITDQSNYVNQFAEISRNRARVFNYIEASWNTHNVSGFEKRISLLSGIDNYSRRNLCNFEVTPCHRLQLNDSKGNVLFRGNRSFKSKAELFQAAEKVLVDLRTPNSYERLEKNLNGFNREEIQRIFSIKPSDENIIISEYQYHHQLLDANEEVVIYNPNIKFKSEKIANNKKLDFINGINAEEKIEKQSTKYRLVQLDEKRYLDTNALEYRIQTIIRWKWIKYNFATKKKVKSEFAFNSAEEAWDMLIKEPETQKYLNQHKTALQWQLRIKGKLTIYGINYHSDKNKAIAVWRQAKVIGSNFDNYTLLENDKELTIELRNEKGKRIAVSNPIEKNIESTQSLIEDCVSVFANRNTKSKYERQEGKFGFNLQPKNSAPPIKSYDCFDSEKEALEAMGSAFKRGGIKKNYLLSGDQGNPEYSFILLDEFGAFLALPAEPFETAPDRDRALKATMLFLKNYESPLSVNEQARSYTWSFSENAKVVLKSSKEYPSKAKAQGDFDKKIIAETKNGNYESLVSQQYEFNVLTRPLKYSFVYGASNSQGRLEPIFKSFKNFDSTKKVTAAYIDFAENLPALQLKNIRKKERNFDFGLYGPNQKTPLAIQYKLGTTKASPAAAKALISYVNDVYTKEGTPRENFIANAISEQEAELYEWRFYKKNTPLASSPYKCSEKEMAEAIKFPICTAVPPISLNECPPKKKVVCPEKSPGKFHYQVCFKDTKNREFLLNSYLAYDSFEEAEAAWKHHWLEVIDIARDTLSYLGDTLGDKRNGRISLEEVYQEPDSAVCTETSLIAVIPEQTRNELGLGETDLIAYHVLLAEMFPIYRINNEADEKCHTRYAYRVVLDEKIIDSNCDFSADPSLIERLIWLSVDCFDTAEEAIEAYCHFYTLAGTPNNCRILCEQGMFYVGLVEVMIESACKFESETEAWNDAFPEIRDLCDSCVPGGVREFIYAAEDCDNYIPVCINGFWTFKVVSPHYFVAEHSCHYETEEIRDVQMTHWLSALEGLDWTKYITTDLFEADTLPPEHHFLLHFAEALPDIENRMDYLCDFVQAIRKCLPLCIKKVETEAEQLAKICQYLSEKYKNKPKVLAFLKNGKFNLNDLQQLSNYFPVHKTEKGYCYRLYWSANDKEISPDGLQPCGCGDDEEKDIAACDAIHIFESSNCYACCEAAEKAFKEFCELVGKKLLTLECTEKTRYGPFSFRLVDKRKELGYHPQQYSCLQEVLDAIDSTKDCVNNMGMHLLEHILLRPKTVDACNDEFMVEENGKQRQLCCLLPICPDYCCDIDWMPDMDKDDPCAEENPDMIYYLPGSDPYSFWATIALPAWDKRFRTNAARKAFEKLLYKEVPALVGLHILWLSPRDMCKFEDAYRVWLEWLQWRQDPDTEQNTPFCNPFGVSPNCLITDCIKHLTSEPACPSIPGAEGDCTCEPQEKRDIDSCCLPPEHEGSLYWGYCPPENNQDDVPGNPEPFSGSAILASSAVESGVETAPQTKAKTVSKKKTTTKKVVDNAAKKALLALVRKRKPSYLKNINTNLDENIAQSKSYERTQFFLSNTPSIQGYKQLVDFFARYSLQKDNNLPAYAKLIKNATWHLMDGLVLDKNKKLGKEDQETLKKSLHILKSKGVSSKIIDKGWNSEELKSLANTTVLKHIKSVLK